MLRVSRVQPGDPTLDDYVGQNRFECLTCPYQYVIKKRYYERKYMKKKEVEDILGGKGAWDNVDKTEGECYARQPVAAELLVTIARELTFRSPMSQREMPK